MTKRKKKFSDSTASTNPYSVSKIVIDGKEYDNFPTITIDGDELEIYSMCGDVIETDNGQYCIAEKPEDLVVSPITSCSLKSLKFVPKIALKIF